MTRRAHVVMTLAFLLAALASLASYRIYSIWMQPVALPQGEAILTVPPGQSLRAVLTDAEKNEWIQGARILGWLAGALELDQHIKAGEYQLATGITAGKMMDTPADVRIETKLNKVCAQAVWLPARLPSCSPAPCAHMRALVLHLCSPFSICCIV